MGQHTPVVEPPLECTPSETPPWPDNLGSEIGNELVYKYEY